MMTIADFAAKRGIPIATVYSWIYRGQAERNNFKVHKFGKVSLIEDVPVKRSKKVLSK